MLNNIYSEFNIKLKKLHEKVKNDKFLNGVPLNEGGQLRFSPVYINDMRFLDDSTASYNRRKYLYSQLDFITPETNILDICCNTGVTSFILAQLFDGIKIYGNDVIPEAIEIANDVLDIYKKENKNYDIKFEVRDYYNITDFSKFDIVFNSLIDKDLNLLNSKIDLYKKRGFRGRVVVLFIPCLDDKGLILKKDHEKRINEVLKNHDSYVISHPEYSNSDINDIMVINKV